MSARSNIDLESWTELRPARPEAGEDGPTEFSSWAFGNIVLTRAVGSGGAARRWRTSPGSLPGHRCVMLACSRSEVGMSSILAVSPSEALNIIPLPTPFEGAAGCEVLMLFLLNDFGSPQKGTCDWVRRLDASAGPGALLAAFMKQLARELPQIPQDQAHGLALATRALVEACLAPLADTSEASDPPSASTMVEKVRLVVRQNMSSPEFGPRQLVRLLGISRSKLYRLLNQAGGVASFINRERLAEAHRRLAMRSDSVSIHVIGSSVGFPDHSSFSRAFRRAFGYSPTQAQEKSLGRCCKLGRPAQTWDSELIRTS